MNSLRRVAATFPARNPTLVRLGLRSCAGIADSQAVKEPQREGNRSMVHFKLSLNKHPLKSTKSSSSNEAVQEWENPFQHPVWSKEEAESVAITHKPPKDISDRLALSTVKLLRFSFDVLAGFKTGRHDEYKYLNRMIFLETVAGVPGMVGGMVRHLHSLRRMERDHGWIHTLLEEAENERMHLLTFLKLKEPGPLFRTSVLLTQGVFFNLFFLTYLLSPKSCHRFVGYIEEEAVRTYTKCLQDIDENKLPLFTNLPAPSIGKSYWRLGPDGMFKDLILAIRADEANHREVNHTFADMHAEKREHDVNPFLQHQNVEKHQIKK